MKPWVLASVLAVAGCKNDRAGDSAPLPRVNDRDVLAKDPPGQTGDPSALPEKGPHPDYPTPVGAGTDKIFLLEDPDRGPPVKLAFQLPRDAMMATEHASCEVDAVSVTCGRAVRAGPPGWRVRRKGKEIVVAHELRPDGGVKRTLVYFATPDGTMRRRVELDDHGRVLAELRFIDGGGRYSGRRRDGSNELAGCGAMAYQTDTQGRISELRCLQWLGEPMHDTDGVGITTYARDERGFVIEEVRLSTDRKPISPKDYVHRMRYTLDANGRTVRSQYVGVDGAPVASNRGCFGYTYAYTPAGLVASSQCTDADGTPLESVRGLAIIKRTYDARGCQLSERRLAPDGSAAVDEVGVNGLDYTVDALCQTTRLTCVDTQGAPIACGPGLPARRAYTYDVAGRQTSVKHYGADGNPFVDPSYGAFDVRWRYDERDRSISQACFDDHGKAAECEGTGFHAMLSTYDDAGRETETRYQDTDGKPASNMGAVQKRNRYDNYDHLVETTSYGADGELLEVRGAAIRRDLFDARHDRFGVLLLDRAGKPARYDACYTGVTCPSKPWHALRIVRRSDGTATANKFFDADGQLIDTIDCTRQPCFD